MSLADISIKRPTFITCIIFVMLAVGLLGIRNLGVDLFPDVTFPVVTVTVVYPGAGPEEIETQVTKPLEDEISTLGGIKRLTSYNAEGVSRVVAEFTLETDVKYAEQQIRDHVGAVKSKLPTDIKEPVIRRLDPADQPVVRFALDADVSTAKLFDLADDVIRPKLEQVPQVGLVDVIGGRKREIHVELDRKKLKQHEIAVTTVYGKVASAGVNVPSGKVEKGKQQTSFRTIGEFKTLED
ncbi:MAG: efflux RND transporter permease subunit, partial [Bdellovibrionota bacterium]